MIRVLPILALVLGLSACVAPQAPSESRPSPGSMNTVTAVEPCTVLSARDVRLTAPYTNTGYGRRGAPSVGPRQTMGTTGGALVGAALGKELGGSDGALVGAILGGLAGGYAGANSDANAPYAFGQEVVVALRNGRQVAITQGISAGDRPLYPGQACGLIGGRAGDARVVAR